MQPVGWLKSPKLSLWSKLGGDLEWSAVTEAKEKSSNGERVVSNVKYSVEVQTRGKEREGPGTGFS